MKAQTGANQTEKRKDCKYICSNWSRRKNTVKTNRRSGEDRDRQQNNRI